MWDLIVSVPDHCLSFYFSNCTHTVKHRLNILNLIMPKCKETYVSNLLKVMRYKFC